MSKFYAVSWPTLLLIFEFMKEKERESKRNDGVVTKYTILWKDETWFLVQNFGMLAHMFSITCWHLTAAQKQNQQHFSTQTNGANFCCEFENLVLYRELSRLKYI